MLNVPPTSCSTSIGMPNHWLIFAESVIASYTSSRGPSISTSVRSSDEVKSSFGVSSRPSRWSARFAIANAQKVCSTPRMVLPVSMYS